MTSANAQAQPDFNCPLCVPASLGNVEPAADLTCPTCGTHVGRTHKLLTLLRSIAKNFPSLELDELRADSPWPPGGDSLTAVEVMLELERELGVSMPADAIDRVDTVGDAIRFFERRLAS